ncbi:MAG: trypsin-like peptidase domain-containing protein [Planctomycetota bacterium]
MRAAFALLILGSAIPASAQELGGGNLTKLKDATAYVRWEANGTVHMGSAYLFRKSGSTGYLLTCAHVVGNAEKVTVVFQAGLPGEKSLEAKVTGKDSSRDTACLRVSDPNLPVPLELSAKTEVRETENVFVAGFPFGELISTSDKNPNISVSRASVSSIRKGNRNEVVVVQLDGNINPGNSGGPVVDSKGRVVGMAAAKVAGTNTAFAVPPEELRKFLTGRLEHVRLNPISCDGTRLRLEVVAQVVDPAGTFKSAGWSWMRSDELKTMKEEDASGVVPKASPLFKDVPLKFDEATGLARVTIEVVRAAGEGEAIMVTWQGCFVPLDGPALWMVPETESVRFKVMAFEPPVKPGDKPGDKPPVKPGDEPPAPGTGLKPADALIEKGRLQLLATVGDMVLSRDGAWLYVLDLSDGKVLKVDAETMALDSSVAIPDSPVCMALQPKSETLMVASRVAASTGAHDDSGKGRLFSVNATTMKITSTMDLAGDPFDVDVSASGIAYVSITMARDLLVVDPARKSSDKAQISTEMSRVHVHPDGTRIYIGTGFSSGDFVCMSTTREPQGKYPNYSCYSYRADNRDQSGGEHVLSPDGKFLIGSRGTALRLAKGGKEADMKPLAKLDPWISAAAAPGCATLVTATREGFLKFITLGSFDLTKSVPAGGICTHLAMDPAKNRLYAHLAPLRDNALQREDTRPGLKCRIPGDLVVWSLK